MNDTQPTEMLPANMSCEVKFSLNCMKPPSSNRL